MRPPPGRALLTCLAALLLPCVVACAPVAGADPAAAAPASTPDTIVYGHQQEPPCVYGGWIEQAYLSGQILDNVVALDDDGRVVPWLAESWRVDPDGLTWRFTLRDGPTFSDGTPVDADAVARNFDHWVDGGNSTVQAWIGSYFDSADALDDRTVAVRLTRPYPRFAENMTQPYFGIQSPRALETRSEEENCTAPIGSGPFVVDRWNRGSDIQLLRRDDYDWAPANAEHTGPAHVRRIDWRFIADPTARTAALRSGEIDAMYDVQAFEWRNLEAEGFELHRYVTGGRPQQISFNTERGPFTDQRVRQAFALSLDRRGAVEAVGKGVIPYEGNGPVSRATPGYDERAAARYDHDPAAAAALLDDAGWLPGPDGVRERDGRPLEVVFPYAVNRTINQDGAAIIQALQQQAEAVGFRVRLVPYPPSAAAAGAYSGPGDYDLMIGYWTAVNAGILHVNWRRDLPDSPNKANSAFYDDPALEQLIVRANSEQDPAAQAGLYRSAQQYIADRALSIGVYDRLSTLAVRPGLHGVRQEKSQGGPIFHDAHVD
ncbi:ABC transporter substrate-binding protein [Pseudonocardia sp. EC080610-09]|uniref:ABC transporter substrate-binding protein n=1 Tax=unclassified Pseudonocardia TaxID=2619320 RepID=UPI0006CB7656|nr:MULTISPECIES: ABC transporter substrate-binding protein [unclassified Pseudonocardia]ALE72854.1 ABC transporter substrate-binding protein [Pseudonocardia sp. EC080625-04]ALL76178.1 ABC transporter substrate-binding protein [Pseudonocardia sp. EC080610-09]ALL83203.1 ABC transporter substrate-binding protein [Pseudonocardia sp. EC080619-01]